MRRYSLCRIESPSSSPHQCPSSRCTEASPSIASNMASDAASRRIGSGPAVLANCLGRGELMPASLPESDHERSSDEPTPAEGPQMGKARF